MKNYLSFGGGINSVALYLLMVEMQIAFEAVFVDHGADWPETYEYVEMFEQQYPLTMIQPNYQGHQTLLGYCQDKKTTPSMFQRWCTHKFKVVPYINYVDKPCFSHIGIDFGERHRAKISCQKGVEKRYLLVEHEIDRDGCFDIIKRHGLPAPPKSSCFFCPFQSAEAWRKLRREHPDLFCVAQKLEKEQNNNRKKGSRPFFLKNEEPLAAMIDDKQMPLGNDIGMEEYPPCECRY